MKKIDELVNLTLKTCENWIKVDQNGLLCFIDPIDKKEISAHYGATHIATAFILLGNLRDDLPLLKKGKTLLLSVIKRWDTSKLLHSFHADFNNFALCVAFDILKDIDSELCNQIKEKVCSTSDSNHDTVNWLPMRWYVNIKRYEWTTDEKYKNIGEACRSKIKRATNKDGGIEDILPKGKSFNLQYDLATVAVLQFMNCRGLEIDLSKEMGFLLNSVAPDGDINYQGRGTNQIFAWGMWLYLLSSSQDDLEIKKAISFLSNKVAIMLENNNLMLNNSKGQEKHLWWDYHYSSVYTSHFLFWMVLSLVDFQKKAIKTKTSELNDSGVTIYRTANYFISTFNGRKKYLAETGPIISSFWMKKYGMINKGTFGPWLGMFGNKNTYGNVVLRNYIGLLKIKHNKNWSKNRIINRLLPNIESINYIKTIPIISKFKIKEDGNTIIIKFDNSRKEKVVFNFPILDSIINIPEISLLADGEPMMVVNNYKIKTQYGWCSIHQSKISSAKEWILRIK
ncbi:hypothetical protein [Polaribacter sp. P097]|uniref:hypothetical protein n=1 Tax=Polaribacter sp. P097 TaxID=3117398 RepID=UPI002FE096DC